MYWQITKTSKDINFISSILKNICFQQFGRKTGSLTSSSSSESFPNTDGFCKTGSNCCAFFGKTSPYLHIFFEIEITPLYLNVKKQYIHYLFQMKLPSQNMSYSLWTHNTVSDSQSSQNSNVLRFYYYYSNYLWTRAKLKCHFNQRSNWRVQKCFRWWMIKVSKRTR